MEVKSKQIDKNFQKMQEKKKPSNCCMCCNLQCKTSMDIHYRGIDYVVKLKILREKNGKNMPKYRFIK